MTKNNHFSARKVAMTVLSQMNFKSHDCSELLSKYHNKTDQKQQATDITYGVVRNLTLIDYVLNKVCSVRADRVNKNVLASVRIGAYEIIYSPASAEYAIVNECVNLVRNEKERGFVNAVLRSLLRAIDNRSAEGYKLFDPHVVPAAREVGCRFKEEILDHKEGEELRFLAKVFSLPVWLIEKWVRNFGIDKTIDICYGSNRKPSVYLRPNMTKTTAQSMQEILAQKDIKSEIGPDGMLCLLGSCAVNELPGYEEGLFSVQDPTAAKVARLISPKQGDVIADLCSAPGTKTTHLAELMDNRGIVFASDKDPMRLKKVSENISRLGLSIIQCVSYETVFDYLHNSRLDAILLDVPCSNTGVMAKRCELRHRINQRALRDLAAVQLGLLNKVAAEFKSCSKICYSTCSIVPEENSQLIQQFLLKNTNFVLIEEALTLPSDLTHGCDGGYVAILQRK